MSASGVETDLVRTHRTVNGDLVGVGLADVISSIRRRKMFVFGMALLGLVLGTLAAVTSPSIYIAEAVIAPANSGQSASGLSSLAGQLGGLGTLAGLTTGSTEDKEEAMATLSSRSLSDSFIKGRKLMPVLFAQQWDAKEGKPSPNLFGHVPTMWDANNLFSQNVRTISEDRRSGMLRVSMTWHDPNIAAEWANAYVQLANISLRDRAISESNRNLTYLHKQLEQTTVIELRAAIYRLLETEIKNIMLAQGNEDYAFKVIDAAVAPERPSKPNRALLVLGGLMGGLLLATLLTVMRDLLASK